MASPWVFPCGEKSGGAVLAPFSPPSRTTAFRAKVCLVPVRQWVLSLPIEIRYRMSYDKRLISDVLAVFLRVVQGWYKTEAKKLGFVKVQGGSVSFLQKFGPSLNATPHYHCLLLDGAYAFIDGTDEPFFVATPPPADEDIKQIAETVAARVIRLLTKHTIRLPAVALRTLADER